MVNNKRTSKHWIYDPKYDVEEFKLEDITEKNFINHLLKLKQYDITFSMISICKTEDS